MLHSVYFARSLKNSKVYVGSTTKDPEDRVKEHNQGTNTWSKQNGPFKLVYFESFLCKEDAKRREDFYKTGVGRRIKQAIIKELDP